MFSAKCRGQKGETAANSQFNPSLTDRPNSLQISTERGAVSAETITTGHIASYVKIHGQ